MNLNRSESTVNQRKTNRIKCLWIWIKFIWMTIGLERSHIPFLKGLWIFALFDYSYWDILTTWLLRNNNSTSNLINKQHCTVRWKFITESKDVNGAKPLPNWDAKSNKQPQQRGRSPLCLTEYSKPHAGMLEQCSWNPYGTHLAKNNMACRSRLSFPKLLHYQPNSFSPQARIFH